MTRKSGKLLRPVYGTAGQLFQPYKVSSAVYTVISPTGNQTSDHRKQSRNSTTELLIHITHAIVQPIN